MQTQTIKEELLKLENLYWKAIRDRDPDMAESLTDYPCIVAGSQGVGSVDRENFRKMMAMANYTLKSFKITDAEVRMLSPDVAVLAYDVHEELIVDGQSVTMDASDASTWVRRGNRWVCALHTESLHGDPYGRDRVVN